MDIIWFSTIKVYDFGENIVQLINIQLFMY